MSRQADIDLINNSPVSDSLKQRALRMLDYGTIDTDWIKRQLYKPNIASSASKPKTKQPTQDSAQKKVLNMKGEFSAKEFFGDIDLSPSDFPSINVNIVADTKHTVKYIKNLISQGILSLGMAGIISIKQLSEKSGASESAWQSFIEPEILFKPFFTWKRLSKVSNKNIDEIYSLAMKNNRAYCESEATNAIAKVYTDAKNWLSDSEYPVYTEVAEIVAKLMRDSDFRSWTGARKKDDEMVVMYTSIMAYKHGMAKEVLGAVFNIRSTYEQKIIDFCIELIDNGVTTFRQAAEKGLVDKDKLDRVYEIVGAPQQLMSKLTTLQNKYELSEIPVYMFCFYQIQDHFKQSSLYSALKATQLDAITSAIEDIVTNQPVKTDKSIVQKTVNGWKFTFELTFEQDVRAAIQYRKGKIVSKGINYLEVNFDNEYSRLRLEYTCTSQSSTDRGFHRTVFIVNDPFKNLESKSISELCDFFFGYFSCMPGYNSVYARRRPNNEYEVEITGDSSD